jgi:hypothetical protein
VNGAQKIGTGERRKSSSRTSSESQVRIYDVADPNRGTVIKAGPEVSEVRFDDRVERNIPNAHLRPASVDDELDSPTDPTPHYTEEPVEHAIVRQGQEAWGRLRNNSTWEDWKKVGAAHVIGRTTAMRDGHINKPKGRSYNAAFSAWQKKFGFQGLDKGDRSRLFDVMDHLNEIDGWLKKLSDTERLRLNHPSSLWRKWKAATATPKPDTKPKPSSMQKLKDELVTVIEERDRYKREIDQGGGDLWNVQDHPRDIAKVIFDKVGKSKAEKVARAILKMMGGKS